MKKKFIILLSLGLAITSAVPSFAQTKWATENAAARDRPSYTKGAIQKIIPNDEPIEVLHDNDKWDVVKIDNGIYYVWSDYLTSQDPNIFTKMIYSPSYFKSAGVIHWGGWRWTYYSQRVLRGGGLKIPGRHVNKYGYVVDKNERICLASSKLSKGTIVDTPFGAQGCVYDSGCPSNTLDVYTNF